MQADSCRECYALRLYSYNARGRYAAQSERYLNFFGRERALVLRGEDLFAEPQHVFALSLTHLGLKPLKLAEFEQRNRGRYQRDKDATLAGLRACFAPHNERLAQMLGQGPLWT